MEINDPVLCGMAIIIIASIVACAILEKSGATEHTRQPQQPHSIETGHENSGTIFHSRDITELENEMRANGRNTRERYEVQERLSHMTASQAFKEAGVEPTRAEMKAAGRQ